jgi:gamma-D-glutamyl-L-lysine dipeptidyl-peptidase
MYGIASVSIVPVRAEPSHRSEMVTQLLFGEHFEVIEQQGEWLRVKIAFDNYEGWLTSPQIAELDFKDFTFLQKTGAFLSYDLVQLLMADNNIYSVAIGSVLPFFENGWCRINNSKFKFDGNAKFPDKNSSSQQLIENAYMYLNAPYLWGGRSPFGIDCSGFTQMVFKLSGYKLLRDASMQAEQGYIVNLLEEAHPGDLAFFDNEEGKITHVGIVAPHGKIIHASGKVRIDSLDHHGIFNLDTKKYSHNLRTVKRVMS